MSRRTAPAVWEARNAVVASGLAPLLVLTGALGFALPPHLALLSGAPAYNVFHIAGGLVGIALVRRGGGQGAVGFNVFPAALFAYRPLDDLLHVALGLGLVGLGALGWRRGLAGEPPGRGIGAT
jgi:hypothetical protein